MKIIRGMHKKTWCEDCTNVGPVELHHLNGWKDYRLHQLVFLCKKCHLNYHQEERMARNWDVKKVGQVRTDVDNLVSKKNVTKSVAFEMVAKKLNLGPSHIQKIYYGIKSTRKKTPIRRGNSSPTLTVSQAVSFWQDMSRWGIEIHG
jgi:hypothetical protein